MDYFSLNEKDLTEILMDMRELRSVFEKKTPFFETDMGLLRENGIGSYRLSTRKQGEVYLTKTESLFQKNLLVKSDNGINNIALYFVRNGNGMIDHFGDNDVQLLSNTHNVLFMHEDYKGAGSYLKGVKQNSLSLHLPIDYFLRLVEWYPQYFETSFLKYQKGESFYLKDNWESTNSQIYLLLSQLENVHLLGNGGDLYSDAKVLEIWSLVLGGVNGEANISEQYCCKVAKDCDKIHEAAFLLTSDIHHPPTIRSLSLQVGINEKKLKYGFKEIYGTTVYGYLFEYKMNKAMELLLHTKKSINEVADLCGYNYPSHFSTAFKRYFGIAPMKVRK